jgi:hypothetical protein
MDNKIFSRVEHEIFLGLKLDENLRWYAQSHKATVKIGRGLASMRKVKQFVGTNALKTMYKSIILPHLSYGFAAWGQGVRSPTTHYYTLYYAVKRGFDW